MFSYWEYHETIPLKGHRGCSWVVRRETTITVPSEDASFVSDALADAGLAVLDTGRRITTEDGPDAEAVLHVAELTTDEQGQATRASTPVRR